MKQAKLIVGAALLMWAVLLFWGRIAPSPQSAGTSRYADIAALLTPFVFVAVGLALILSARRAKKP